MKILYITAVLKKGDGVSHVVRDLVKQAINNNHTVQIVTGQHNTDFEIPPSCEVALLPSVKIPFYSEYSFPLFIKKEVQKIIDDYGPDVIHVHSPDPASYFAKQYALKKGIRIIATHHSDFLRYLKFFNITMFGPLVRFLLRKFYRGFDSITTPSEFTKQDLLALGVNPSPVVLGWGTDTRCFNPDKKSEEWRKNIAQYSKKDSLILFCAARLVWYKGFQTLLETYSPLCAKFPEKDIKLTVAGGGPIAEQLKKMCTEIILLGNLSSEELSVCFASSDIFVFPSYTETFGSVTLEAMASGLPVVVSDKGGQISFVENERTGLFARTENPESFAQQVERLVLDNELREKLSKNALEFAQKQTWEEVFRKIEAIYKNNVLS